MKITSNMFQVGGGSLSHSSDAAIYLINTSTGSLLIDSGTGMGLNSVIQNIQTTGTDFYTLTHLFLTHCHYDHSGGANSIRERTGCVLVAHEYAAEFLESGDSEVSAASWYNSFLHPTPIDVKVQGKEQTFTIGDCAIQFFHTPGHSPGSSVLLVESDGKRVLFGQDVHGPLNDMLLSNRDEYILSLEFLISLKADILCEGHFGVYYGVDKVKRFIESFL